MSKSCCFAVVLAVICLPVILFSLEADAQPTIDETMTCSASTLEEVVNMVKIVASNQQQRIQGMKNEIKDVKTLLVSGIVKTNETCGLEVLVSGIVKTNETCGLEDTVKDEIKNETELLSNDIKDVKALLASSWIALSRMRSKL